MSDLCVSIPVVDATGPHYCPSCLADVKACVHMDRRWEVVEQGRVVNDTPQHVAVPWDVAPPAAVQTLKDRRKNEGSVRILYDLALGGFEGFEVTPNDARISPLLYSSLSTLPRKFHRYVRSRPPGRRRDRCMNGHGPDEWVSSASRGYCRACRRVKPDGAKPPLAAQAV